MAELTFITAEVISHIGARAQADLAQLAASG